MSPEPSNERPTTSGIVTFVHGTWARDSNWIDLQAALAQSFLLGSRSGTGTGWSKHCDARLRCLRCMRAVLDKELRRRTTLRSMWSHTATLEITRSTHWRMVGPRFTTSVPLDTVLGCQRAQPEQGRFHLPVFPYAARSAHVSHVFPSPARLVPLVPTILLLFVTLAAKTMMGSAQANR
jgi:hypothetical protein